MNFVVAGGNTNDCIMAENILASVIHKEVSVLLTYGQLYVIKLGIASNVYFIRIL